MGRIRSRRHRRDDHRIGALCQVGRDFGRCLPQSRRLGDSTRRCTGAMEHRRQEMERVAEHGAAEPRRGRAERQPQGEVHDSTPQSQVYQLCAPALCLHARAARLAQLQPPSRMADDRRGGSPKPIALFSNNLQPHGGAVEAGKNHDVWVMSPHICRARHNFHTQNPRKIKSLQQAEYQSLAG